MRKISLSILFSLVMACGFGQVVFNGGGSSSNTTTNATSYATSSVSFTAGQSWILVVGSTFSTTPDLSTVTHSDFTITFAGSHTDATGRISLYLLKCINTVTTAITASFGSQTQTSGALYLARISGESSSPFRQFVTNQGSSANPSWVMGSIKSGSLVVVAAWSSTNPFGGTAGSGYTERVDNGGATPTRGLYVMTGTTTTLPVITAASSNWFGYAAEIAAPGRRVISIN